MFSNIIQVMLYSIQVRAREYAHAGGIYACDFAEQTKHCVVPLNLTYFHLFNYFQLRASNYWYMNTPFIVYHSRKWSWRNHPKQNASMQIVYFGHALNQIPEACLWIKATTGRINTKIALHDLTSPAIMSFRSVSWTPGCYPSTNTF